MPPMPPNPMQSMQQSMDSNHGIMQISANKLNSVFPVMAGGVQSGGAGGAGNKKVKNNVNRK